MMVYDRETIEKILNQLETLDYPFSFYKVNREQGNPKLKDKTNREGHAAKVYFNSFSLYQPA